MDTIDPTSVSMGLTYLDCRKAVDDKSNEATEEVNQKGKPDENQERVIKCYKAVDTLLESCMDIMADKIEDSTTNARLTMALYNYVATVSDRRHGEDKVINNFNKRMTKSVLKDLESEVKKSQVKPLPLSDDKNGDQIKLLEKIVAFKRENK